MEDAILIALGLCIGSFLNVVVARLPHGRSLVRPRSSCPTCAGAIAWYDNVPVVSWILLKGKCRKCHSAISLRYPVIELLTAVLFVAMGHSSGFGLELFLRDLPLVSALVAVTFIDLEHRIIPDEISIGGTAYGLLTAVVGFPGFLPAVIGAGVGFGVFFGFAWAYERLTGRVGLGGGDVKLLAMLGAFLGIQGVFFTILISSVLGTIVGIAWAIGQKKKDLLGVAIPYGPFLVLGALVYRLLGDEVFSFL